MNLIHLLEEQAARQPAHPALIDCTHGQPRLITAAQLVTAANQAATLLRQAGVRASDTLLLFHPMAADLYIALAAIFRLGAVAMFVDPGQARGHIDRCCTLVAPRALIATPQAQLLRLFSAALRRIPIKVATGWGAPGAIHWQRFRRQPPLTPVADCPPEAPALITFTSGSTGQPKAAVRTHGFLRQQHTILDATLGLTSQDVVLTTLPIFVLSHLAAGVTTLIPSVDLRRPGQVQTGPLIRQIMAHGVTCLEASPALLERLARDCLAQGVRLPAVTKIFTGGGPVFPHLMAQLQTLAPNAVVMAVYGSTEAEPIAHVGFAEVSRADQQRTAAGAGLLVGHPVAAIQVRILPDRWGEPIGPQTPAELAAQALPPTAPGEIVVSGPHVLGGYLQGQGDAETKFRVGDQIWHRTGDAGYFDHQGRLWLLGRCAARLADAHGVIYPFAVEASLRQHPAVKQCALVGVNGQRLVAVELHEPIAAATLADWRAQLAWAHINAIRILPRIPVDKRHNAKLDYPALHRLLRQSS